MSHLVLPDVPPDVVEELRRRAERHGRAVEDEARAVLEEALGLSRARALAGARRLRAQLAGRPWSDSTLLLQQDRER
jgi:plasmid stability protein